MSRIISFGSTKALKYIPDMKEKLLNGSKTQTIRKPRKKPFEVGEKIQIYWKQRAPKVYRVCWEDGFSGERHEDIRKGKLTKFCADGKEIFTIKNKEALYEYGCYSRLHCIEQIDGSEKLFDAEITEIFKIKKIQNYIQTPFMETGTSVSKKDGFENLTYLIEFLNKAHKGETYFEVIRWRRIE